MHPTFKHVHSSISELYWIHYLDSAPVIGWHWPQDVCLGCRRVCWDQLRYLNIHECTYLLVLECASCSSSFVLTARVLIFILMGLSTITLLLSTGLNWWHSSVRARHFTMWLLYNEHDSFRLACFGWSLLCFNEWGLCYFPMKLVN
jgi:hypothetical protein